MRDEVAQKKILLVEDDLFMADLLVQELSRDGFDVSLAKSGKEALQRLKGSSYHLVLLDILLPDINGIEVLREIKNNPVGAGIKVVILSNLSGEKEIEEAKNLGAAEYLVKANTSLGEISDKIKQLLGV